MKEVGINSSVVRSGDRGSQGVEEGRKEGRVLRRKESEIRREETKL